MAEDDSQKTEEPSWRKLDEARKQGQVVQSREVSNWFVMSGGAAALLIFAPHIAGALRQMLVLFLERAGQMRVDAGFAATLHDALFHVAVAVAPALGLMMLAGLAGPLLQHGLLFAPDRLGFKLGHISPGSGLARLFSATSAMEFLKGLIKMVVVGGVAAYLLRPELDRLTLLPSIGAAAAAREMSSLAVRLVGGVVVVVAAIAIADYVYQRMAFLRSMRMSKQEVKEEYKQQEGDPFIRGKLRQIRTERARKRMMAAVPDASVVVTNPTHVAVALAYELNTAGAPRVVAKGSDLVAARIREVARAHDVPIVENPPLARALYATVEIDQEIPTEHYKAVAEIIGYVFRLNGKLKPAPAR